jgi:hypothetical protein
MSQYEVLVARLNHELETLDQVVAIAQSQVRKAQQTGDDDYFQAAALSLQNYYMGVERIFKEIAKQIDQTIPTGASSHRDLLEQMGLALPQSRPPVLSGEAIARLDEYRAFRHVVMHRYALELRSERVDALVQALADCHAQVAADLKAFCQFLGQLDRI